MTSGIGNRGLVLCPLFFMFQQVLRNSDLKSSKVKEPEKKKKINKKEILLFQRAGVCKNENEKTLLLIKVIYEVFWE